MASVPTAGAGSRATAASSRASSNTSVVGSGSEKASISRNKYGVPTITSSTISGMWFGAGYAQAQDRMVQLELVRRTVEGTLSAIGGKSELPQDEDIRTFFYTPAELQAQYQALPASIARSRAGVLERHQCLRVPRLRGRPPEGTRAVGVRHSRRRGRDEGSLPARPMEADRHRRRRRLPGREFGGGGGSELSNLAYLRYLDTYLTKKGDSHASADAEAVFNDTRWINDPTAPTTVPGKAPAAAPGKAPAVKSLSATLAVAEKTLQSYASISTQDILAAAAALKGDHQMILNTGIRLKVPAHGGSNAFVVAPWKSKDHHALLWGAPQEGFGTPSIDGEEYLHGPGYDAGGMDITGEPFVLIGRNADAAWTTTSEELVDQRVYSEKVHMNATPPSYWYDGKWTPLVVIHEHIPVVHSKPASYTVYRTVDGPLFYIDPRHDVAFADAFRLEARRPDLARLRPTRRRQEPESVRGFHEGHRDTAQLPVRRQVRQHRLLRRRPCADRAFLLQGRPTSAGCGGRFRAVARVRALEQDAAQHQPRSGLSRQLEHKTLAEPGTTSRTATNSGEQISRSSLISKMLAENNSITVSYLESIEHSIGQIDNGDNTRPAAPYFVRLLREGVRPSWRRATRSSIRQPTPTSPG